MLNCMETYRSMDKKPCDNNLDESLTNELMNGFTMTEETSDMMDTTAEADISADALTETLASSDITADSLNLGKVFAPSPGNWRRKSG